MQPPNYPPPPPPAPALHTSASPRPTTPRSTSAGPNPLSRSASKTPVIGYPQLQDNVSPSSTPTPRESPLPTRRSSLGNLLRRTKSTDRFSSKKGSKNASPNAPPVPKSPPRLPEIPIQNGAGSQLKNFGGSQMDSVASAPKQSIDASTIRTGFNINEDPYSGVGSITNRGRYSYASSTTSTINGPRRLRKRKDPTPFNILIIGARNSGKTSFLQFLKQSLATKAHKRGIMHEITNGAQHGSESDDFKATPDSSFTKEYIEADIDGERVGITLWDSAGYEKSVVDLQLRETVAFIESKFEETFAEETRISRNPSAKDTRIHCAFFLLDPVRLDSDVTKPTSSKQANGKPAGLNEDLDLQVFRALQGKTTVIPVISKADTCTTSHMADLKRLVVTSLQEAKLNPLEALDFDTESDPIDDYLKMNGKPRKTNGVLHEEDEEYDDDQSARSYDASSDKDTSAVSNIIPLSVISPDHYGEDFVGRQFPWGFADPYNAQHCDFVRLKEAVFSEWRGEMRVASHETWYENWRTNRLSPSGGRQKPERGRAALGRAF